MSSPGPTHVGLDGDGNSRPGVNVAIRAHTRRKVRYDCGAMTLRAAGLTLVFAMTFLAGCGPVHTPVTHHPSASPSLDTVTPPPFPSPSAGKSIVSSTAAISEATPYVTAFHSSTKISYHASEYPYATIAGDVRLDPHQTHGASAWIVVASGNFSAPVASPPPGFKVPTMTTIAVFIDPATGAILSIDTPAPFGLT